MNRFFCNFQPEGPTNFVYHHRKGPRIPGKPHTKKDLQADVDKAMKEHPVAYEVTRKKPGYTHITGATLFLGHEGVKGLRTGLDALGAGRVFMSGKLEVAEPGQTTKGFLGKIQKTVREKAHSLKIYKNAVMQIGKYDILKTDDSAEQIYERMQKIWAMLAKHDMKIHACTIPPFDEGVATPDQEDRRQTLNKLILDTDEPLFNVIDMAKAKKTVDAESPHLYINDKTGEIVKSREKPEGKGWKRRREIPKSDKDIRTVVYLESLIASGRYGPKHYEQFAHPPKKVAYAIVGDSFTKPVESSASGTMKKPGEYVSSVPKGKVLKPENLPKKPGATSEKMAERLERKIIPALTTVAGYRSAVIQASAEDVLAPLDSPSDMAEAEEAIKKNLKRMYRRCLESNKPVMVVALTLPPLRGEIERLYPGEKNREARELHLELAENINKFIVKEIHRLSQHPKNRYKRVMCVRVHEWFGTRKGYVKKAYRGRAGGFNRMGHVLIGREIHKMMNMMQDGVDSGKKLYARPKRKPDGTYLRDERGRTIFEVPIYDPWNYLMDEHNYEPSGGWKEVKNPD